MATSEERQARALEGILAQLTLLVALQRKQLEKMLNVDELKELRTQSGRLVGYALPNQDLVAYDKAKVTESGEYLVPLPDKYYLVITDMFELPDGNTSFTGKMYDQRDVVAQAVSGMMRIH